LIKRIGSSVVALTLMVLPLSAVEDKKETDRLENCGTVMKEIMDIPDDIPQDLIDKAECVIIYSLGFEGRLCRGRQLRPRRHDLPYR
jgi:SH3 domain-containing YSC84-like protein 1